MHRLSCSMIVRLIHKEFGDLKSPQERYDRRILEILMYRLAQDRVISFKDCNCSILPREDLSFFHHAVALFCGSCKMEGIQHDAVSALTKNVVTVYMQSLRELSIDPDRLGKVYVIQGMSMSTTAFVE